MSSKQATGDKVTCERKIEVEKDRVPKMTTHFESLAEKSKDEPLHDHVETTVPVKVTAAATDKEQPQQQKTSGGSIHEETQGRPGHSLEEISNLRGRAQQNSAEAIRAAEERYQKAKDSTQTERHQHQGAALQDTEEAPKDYTTAAMEKTQQGKDYAAQKAVEAKDVLAAKGQSAAQLGGEKAKAAKEAAADASKVAAEYVGEKAAVAKDATVEGGKGAAGYVGKVASDVKDLAVVAGWGATHYTMEKVAEATKTVAGVTASAAGYTKDKVAGAGQTVGGYAAEKLAATKDAVVASEEKAADFAVRKKVEAQKDLEARKLAHERVEEEQGEVASEKFKEYSKGGTEEEYEEKPKEGGTAGTVFQAIGETIVEIGQTTKDLLVGQSPAPVQDKDKMK